MLENAPLVQPIYLPQYALQNLPAVYESVMHRWLTHYAASTEPDNGAEHVICIIYRRQMDKLLQRPSLQNICNVEAALNPALMVAGAGKSKFQEMKWLITAARFILKCYHYNHA